MGAAAAIVAVVSTAISVKESRDARKQQKKAEKIQAKRAGLENARARRSAVAQSRRARASAIAQGETQGISGGSQVAGAAGSITSQGASNVSFLNQLEGFDQARFGALSSARDSQSRSNQASAVAGAATPFADFSFLSRGNK